MKTWGCVFLKIERNIFFACLHKFYQKQALAGPPDILVSTPACVHTCLSIGALQPNAIQDSLSMLVLDEVKFGFC